MGIFCKDMPETFYNEYLRSDMGSRVSQDSLFTGKMFVVHNFVRPTTWISSKKIKNKKE